MIAIIKKTIEEIRKAEQQATKLIREGEQKKEQILSSARDQINKADAQSKQDLAKMRLQKIEEAKTKAKADAAELLKRESARIKDQTKRLESNVGKVATLILKEFKQVIQ